MAPDPSLFSIVNWGQPRWSEATRRFKSQVIYVLSGLILISYSLYAFLIPEWAVPGETGRQTMFSLVLQQPTSRISVAFFALFIVSGLALLANRIGKTSVAAWALILLWYLVGVVPWIVTSETPSEVTGGIVLLILIAGLLKELRGIIIALLISMLALGMWALGTDAYANADTSVVTILLLAIASAVLTGLFLRYVTDNRINEVEEVMTAREKTAAILKLAVQRVGERVSAQAMAAEVAAQLHTRFDFISKAAIYRTADADESVYLLAEAGELLHDGEVLPFQLVLVNLVERVAKEGTYAIRHLQEGSTSAQGQTVNAAFPLRLGKGIIGVLDLYSENRGTFQDQHMMRSFQNFADNLALALDNAAQFEEIQNQSRENARLAQEAATNLQKVERLNERLTGRAWTDYLRKTEHNLGKTFDFETHETISNAEMTRAIVAAVKNNDFVIERKDDALNIAVPLRVRGRVIGAVEFELDKDRNLALEEIDLVQEVTDRLGLAVENTRLVDESQLAAQRETFVNQISSRLQTSNNVEIMLAEAVRGLNTALRADSITIRLGKPTPQKNSQGG